MRTVLDDGTRVYCLQPFEAKVIDRDVLGYFAHGIAVAPGDTVLDVGANIGLFGVRVTQKCRGDVALYCVEPIPQIRATLEKNLDKAATIVPWAIGDTSGAVEIEYFPRVPGTSRIVDVPDDEQWVDVIQGIAHKDKRFGMVAKLVPRAVYGVAARFLRAKRERVRCERRTLSELIDHYKLETIALLKLDIEGSELEALRGLRAEHWPRIQQVVAEIHDRKRDLPAITHLLEEHGLTVTIGERDCDDDDEYRCCNIYATR
ncbi:MAG: methyltransferase FkbM family [Myxococcales bacterium]|nr:methyltransferase FkbM family [Myxococcales bacterium]